MNLIKSFLFIVCLLLDLITYSQVRDCEKFDDFALQNIVKLKSKMAYFEKPTYLSNIDFISIILPEYVTFSKTKNQIELFLIESSLNFENNSLDLSFGPFQMKLSFIQKVIANTPTYILIDKELIKLKTNGFKVDKKVLKHLNSINTQWIILRAFEYLNKQVYFNSGINGLRCLYNSGFEFCKAIYFSKIDCNKKTYNEWANYLIELK